MSVEMANCLRWAPMMLLCFLLSGCAVRYVQPPPEFEYEEPPVTQPTRRPQAIQPPPKKPPARLGWSMRAISEKEISRLNEKDPEMTPSVAYEILARLNVRARYYMADDIKSGRVMRVPYDFRAYKNWTPLPRQLPQYRDTHKLILVAKDIPFLGWYEYGRLVGDTPTCIGKQGGWTRAGVYNVLEKDANHFSRSYLNTYGQPTPMPLALRIYGRVWIHVGDVVGGYCSHGCINVPLRAGDRLFRWTPTGTPVWVVESLAEVEEHERRAEPERQERRNGRKSRTLAPPVDH